ncbi:subtilisin-like protease SBT5.6 [Pistacia vera]|uniref:subtilisin-like protease SBT5.6 n=1 Tax=Pistacia vera TaxID=55513 RepID=UPI0012637975|nr:subtilisin-like protease SBT5.6 [Pistacia vera]
MNNINIFLFVLFLLPLLASCEEKNIYIVQFRGHNGEKALHEIEDTHHSYLLSVKNNEEEAKASRLYSYQYSINGFAAVLTSDEASKLSELEEVVSVHKSEPGLYTLQTTRSWEFVGLNEGGEGLLSKAKYGQEVIVGVLDSGIWPESESFNDGGMGPVPKSWKGICQTGVAFDSSHCNNFDLKCADKGSAIKCADKGSAIDRIKKVISPLLLKGQLLMETNQGVSKTFLR